MISLSLHSRYSIPIGILILMVLYSLHLGYSISYSYGIHYMLDTPMDILYGIPILTLWIFYMLDILFFLFILLLLYLYIIYIGV